MVYCSSMVEPNGIDVIFPELIFLGAEEVPRLQIGQVDSSDVGQHVGIGQVDVTTLKAGPLHRHPCAHRMAMPPMPLPATAWLRRSARRQCPCCPLDIGCFGKGGKRRLAITDGKRFLGTGERNEHPVQHRIIRGNDLLIPFEIGSMSVNVPVRVARVMASRRVALPEK